MGLQLLVPSSRARLRVRLSAAPNRISALRGAGGLVARPGHRRSGLRAPLRRAASAPLERVAFTGGGPRRLPERTARPLQPVLRSTVAGRAGAGGPAAGDAADQEPVSRPARSPAGGG